MFRVPLRFTLHDLLNLRGLAQVRAVGKQGRRSLCFHRFGFEGSVNEGRHLLPINYWTG